MPDKRVTYICKLCDAEFEDEGHAITCEEAHVLPENLSLEAPASIPAFGGGIYNFKEPWPEAFIVKDKVSGTTATNSIMHAKKPGPIAVIPAEGKIDLKKE